MLCSVINKKVFSFLNSNFMQRCFFFDNKLKADKRIGPHNEIIYSYIVGHMLGDGHLEYRSGSTRLTLHIGLPNREYITWLHGFYIKHGYCTNTKLKFKTQIGKKGKIYFSTKINTFSFKSFNNLHSLFYKVDNEYNCKYIKRIPATISEVLTPEALAIWFMDDASKHNSGIVFHTNSFTIEDNILLKKALYKRYNINSSFHKQNNSYILYISKKEKISIKDIVEPYMHKSMFYKLKNL